MSKSITPRNVIKKFAYSLFYSPSIDIKGQFIELPALFVHLKKKHGDPKLITGYSILVTRF